jgi:hypothetical protein
MKLQLEPIAFCLKSMSKCHAGNYFCGDGSFGILKFQQYQSVMLENKGFSGWRDKGNRIKRCTPISATRCFCISFPMVISV